MSLAIVVRGGCCRLNDKVRNLALAGVAQEVIPKMCAPGAVASRVPTSKSGEWIIERGWR